MKEYSKYHPVRMRKEFPASILKKIRLTNPSMWTEFQEQILFKWGGIEMALEPFNSSGKNIFQISSSLQFLLSKTIIDDLTEDCIRLPYNGFYISFDYAITDIEGVYVYRWPEYGSGLEFTFVNGDRSYNYCISKGENVLNGLSEARQIKWDDAIRLEEYEEVEIDRNIIQYFKLAIGALLYLSLPKNDITEQYPNDLPVHLKTNLEKADTKRRKEKAEQAIKEAGYTKIKFVGQSFASMTTGVGGDKATHWRRGHWRNQAYGEGMKQTRLIWIMPMIINAEKGEPQKGHIYTT